MLSEEVTINLPKNVDAALVASLISALNSRGWEAELKLVRCGRGQKMRIIGTRSDSPSE
jgi:hypothetical protein